MTKLHNMRAYEAGHLLVSLLSTVVHLFCASNLFIQLQPLLTQAGDGVNPEETQAPPFVTDMELWKVIPTHSRWGWAHTISQRIIHLTHPQWALTWTTTCFIDDVSFIHLPVTSLLGMKMYITFSVLIRETTMTMEMTTPVPSQWLLRWKLVVVARLKEHLTRWRKHGRHKWRGMAVGVQVAVLPLSITLKLFSRFFLFFGFALWTSLTFALAIFYWYLEYQLSIYFISDIYIAYFFLLWNLYITIKHTMYVCCRKPELHVSACLTLNYRSL